MTWWQRLLTVVRAQWRALVDEDDEVVEADEPGFLAEAEAQLAALRQALAEARAQAKRSEMAMRAAAGLTPTADRSPGNRRELGDSRRLVETLSEQHQADRALADRLAAAVAELAARLSELRRRTTVLARREELRRMQRAGRGGAWRAALDEHAARLARREDRLAAQDEWERDSHDSDA